MLKPKKGHKIHTFATSHSRASAIETVAGLYKDRLEVSVESIDTPGKAEVAANKAFQEIKTSGAGGYNRDISGIVDRYKALGATGAVSLVQLRVAKESGFDFQTFYGEVDDLLGLENTEPKIM